MIDISLSQLTKYEVIKIDKDLFVVQLSDDIDNKINIFFNNLNEIVEFAEGLKKEAEGAK
jgi:hypothetical protein